MSSLGEVLMLSHVRIQTSDMDTGTSERQERLLMLFTDVLLVLSVTSRVSGYIYKVNCQPLWCCWLGGSSRSSSVVVVAQQLFSSRPLTSAIQV